MEGTCMANLKINKVVEPVPEWIDIYKEMFHIYKASYEGLKAQYDALAKL